MKAHLVTLHESMHVVAAAICLAGIPGVSGSMVKARISVEDALDGAGECALLYSDSARSRVEPSYVNAWAACGPLGFYFSAKDIGRAIAEGRHSEEMSTVDQEVAKGLSPVDQFVAAAGARMWLSLMGPKRIVLLDNALRTWEARYFEPFIPVSAFCPSGLAGKLRLEARKLITRYLPAKAAAAAPTLVEIL